jgi:hypothetical protein
MPMKVPIMRDIIARTAMAAAPTYVENSCERGMRISVVARWMKIRITLGFSKEDK